MDNSISSISSQLVSSSKRVKEIQIYSLRTLVSKFEVKDAILKMDCEGYEYNLLDEDEEILRRFRMIQIEYHYGYEKLEEKLKKAGFKVKHTEPINFYNAKVGYIYAEIR